MVEILYESLPCVHEDHHPVEAGIRRDYSEFIKKYQKGTMRWDFQNSHHNIVPLNFRERTQLEIGNSFRKIIKGSKKIGLTNRGYFFLKKVASVKVVVLFVYIFVYKKIYI